MIQNGVLCRLVRLRGPDAVANGRFVTVVDLVGRCQCGDLAYIFEPQVLVARGLNSMWYLRGAHERNLQPISDPDTAPGTDTENPLHLVDCDNVTAKG